MNASSTTASLLNKLLQTNNDRNLTYTKAAADVSELDLKTIFLTLSDESKKNALELTRELMKLGAVVDAHATSVAGRVYRTWINLKTFLTGRDRSTIIQSCKSGEVAVQNIYRDAISSNELSTEVRQLIRNQQLGLKSSVDLISNYAERSQYGYAGSW